MDKNHKMKLNQALENNKNAIRSIRENLQNVPESEAARKCLQDAEFNIMNGIHSVSWIGLQEDIVTKDPIHGENIS